MNVELSRARFDAVFEKSEYFRFNKGLLVIGELETVRAEDR